MFGSPSGPLYDPCGALAGNGTIVEGWLLARLDVHLPIEAPYGDARSTGSVAAILIAPAAEAPLVPAKSEMRSPAADWRATAITTAAAPSAAPVGAIS